MKYFKVVGLIFLMIFMGNAFANTNSSVNSNISDSQCRATYTLDDGKLSVPCVKVLNPAKESQFYSAELQQITDAEPLQFSVTPIVKSNEENQDDSCVAIYSVESGDVYIPCVDMVNSSGEVESDSLTFKTISPDSLSLVQLAQGTFASVRRDTRNNIPEANTGFTWPLPYNFRNNGGYKFGQFSKLGGNVYHPAQDWNVPDYPGGSGNGDKGLNVVAVANGKVVDVRHNSWGGLVIQHNYKGETWYSQYGHVQNITVSKNTIVTKGQKVAEIGKVTEFNNVKYAHLHFEIREADHPNPDYAPYWSGLKQLSNIKDWYEDPEIFIPTHSSYSQSNIKLSSRIQVSSFTQGSSANVNVTITNYGSSTFTGNFAAAIHSLSGQFLGDLDRKNNFTVRAGQKRTLSFSTSNVTWTPGSYQLQIKYESPSAGVRWDVVPISAYYYYNPINIKIIAGSKRCTSASQCIDQCIAKYRSYFGNKSGSKYTCNSNYYCQRTTGSVTNIRVRKDLSGRNFEYYWGGWGSLGLSNCE